MKIYDADIRKLLVESFCKVDEYIREDTIFVNEMDICGGLSRVDIAVINGKLHGYEIKSKQDNLDRLPLQVESYCRVFDTMSIVAYESHLEGLKVIVPSWWGIKCISEKKGKAVLKSVRKEKINKGIDIQAVALLLWKPEMVDLLTTYGNISRGFASKSREQLSKMIVNNVNCCVVNDYVKGALKSRSNWKAEKLQVPCDDLHYIQPN
jgi:hypothetical protein